MSLYPPNQAQTGGSCYWWCRKLWLAEEPAGSLSGEGTPPFPMAWLRVSGSRSNDSLETKKEPFIWLLVGVSDKTHPLAWHHPQGRRSLWAPLATLWLGEAIFPTQASCPQSGHGLDSPWPQSGMAAILSQVSAFSLQAPQTPKEERMIPSQRTEQDREDNHHGSSLGKWTTDREGDWVKETWIWNLKTSSPSWLHHLLQVASSKSP